MAFEVSAGGTNFVPAPAGLHPAYCYGLIDLGTQAETFGGKTSTRKKVRLLFELMFEKLPDGQPVTIGVTYTADLSDKANLRKALASWRSRDFTPEELKRFDLENVVGAKCQLNIVHKPKPNNAGVSDLIQSILPVPKGQSFPAMVHPKTVFTIGGWDQAAFDALPNWIKNKIAASPEGARRLGGRPTGMPAGPAEPPGRDGDGLVPF